ncbi:hypothetical protein A2738_01740 [Candidatus Nomurabacteria bacterium RIFCSPHIGHO2_01_FULL_42_15]|uniref:Uncharacterized protein n=1 Tax=Candidatus Nomurabacteria bacterium RIFCSPHIGHO2_01_FULL_42_15 TaxID=1801742 RepID=A0A1F6VG50_9BACT|nr:MAG: hypothetical protein A2738_01740 [Candidatus Nomurabacteria bacterium RIFCSPHIGHO2_01_FULL_42_15]OGI92992.1 MAG: hypothetical protein A3A99_00430 [Candidatus Nomurabacteria bacterium RIFCSPLOWO2_01_FULL_41_18]
MPISNRLLSGPSFGILTDVRVKKKSISTTPRPEKFKLVADFKTGSGVTVKRDTIGISIPHKPQDWMTVAVWVPKDFVRLKIPCKPGEIVIRRVLVESVA